ncbi:MAG: DUF4440 domain-containing protein [bacterium]|nr:DUF4440 domain-containing protein [bacterium]
MRSTTLAFMAISMLCSVAFGQELSEEQMGPWKALETQVGLYMKRDWEEHKKYIHPKAIDWWFKHPAPIQTTDKADRYFQIVEEHADKAIAHHMVPVSVVVVGDVAIINAYVHVLTKPEDKAVETVYQLHNTWKKEGNQWQLLATCNSIASTSEDDDD